ncbi:MAG: acyl-CoA/acyl-ACP dehydrogenase [Zoogloeaceae bacterium]|jgi:alkylation response protein AidB-like acyl-CoA dehydrogenase|nr:acyl-CoA/acyl-ACP dehydrogenase [Zoogloeaceae bacterium]
MMSTSVTSADTPASSASKTGEIPDLDQLLPRVTQELAKTATHYDRTGELPRANLSLLHTHGLLGLAVPAEFGGPGLPLVALRHVVGAVAKGEPSTALLVTMQYIHHRILLGKSGWAHALRTKVYRDALESGALINSFRAEAEAGSPFRGGLPATTARRVPDGWRLSGEKICSSGIDGVTWLLVWAKSDDPVPLVGAWLVHRDSPGIRVVETWDYLGMRATGSHTVVFEDVLTPQEHAVDVFPSPQPPAPEAADTLAFQRVNSALVAALYDGVAQAARDAFIDWLKHTAPTNLGAPLATLSTLRQEVGRLDGLLLQNRFLLDTLAGETSLRENEAGQLQAAVTENVVTITGRILDLTGNHGLRGDSPFQRHHRDALCGRVHAPQRDIVWNAAGKLALS